MAAKAPSTPSLIFSRLLRLTLAIPTGQEMVERASTDKLVFAHFLVGTVSSYTQSDWETDMKLAQSTGIDAFALNIGTDDYTNTQLGYAYLAANAVGFKLFISFDFNASPGFADYANQIVPRLTWYANNVSQVQWGSGALISTFGGDGFDWSAVRTAVKTNNGATLEIIPNYQAANVNSGNIDGAYNWNAWPSRNNQPIESIMEADGDIFYQNQLAGRPYMAGVSPWFFTHYPANSYNKNWIFLSDTLLIDRWNQILDLQPQLVEIETWNDFGESHYIGPLTAKAMDFYNTQWATGFPHDGWRLIIAPYIRAYKTGNFGLTAASEALVYWYRPHPKSTTCSDPVGLPTGSDYTSDAVWAVTILASPATIAMTSGSNTYTTTAPAGINYFAVTMGAGQPTFSVQRSGSTIISATGGLAISDSGCTLYNFNAFVGSATV